MGSVGSSDNISKQDIKDALEYYQQDGYYINSVLRGGDYEFDDKEKYYMKILDKATQDNVKHDILYRIVDPSVVFGKLSDIDADNLRAHLLLGDEAYDRGAYSQGIKARMENLVNSSVGKELHEKGYMSTTYDLDEAINKQFDSTHSNSIGVILKITNAKGLKGAEIGGEEKEVLLKRNYRYKFKGVRNEDGRPVVLTEVY